MLTQRACSRLLRVTASLLLVVGSWTSCAAPPPPVAKHPSAAPPTAAATGEPPERWCGAVQRAKRTWVGFADGMTLDDMVPIGHAAEMVVRVLDTALCAVSRGEPVAALETHRLMLRAFAAGGGKLEVTEVLWQDASASHARVALQAASPRADRWSANVVRHGETWRIASFGMAAP